MFPLSRSWSSLSLSATQLLPIATLNLLVENDTGLPPGSGRRAWEVQIVPIIDPTVAKLIESEYDGR